MLSIEEQHLLMRRHWPEWCLLDCRFQKGIVEVARFARWHGIVKPMDYSPDYRVNVEYEIGDRPKIFVVRPSLERCNGQPIPHQYGDGGLCLYFPAVSEWTPAEPIATRVITWIPLWLTYYELWHTTKKWHGGGTNHKPVGERPAA